MPSIRSRREQALLATDIHRGTYFFLDLRPRTTGPVRVALGGREHCGPNYRVERASYPFFALEYVAEGTGRIRFKGSDWQALKPGAIFAYGPGVEFAIDGGEGHPLVKYFVCFNGKGDRTWLTRHLPRFGDLTTLGHHSEIREIFDLMVREGTERIPATREICDHLSIVLLLKIGEARRQRAGEWPSASRERFLKLKALMDDSPAHFSSVKEMAEVIRVDSSGLNRLFRRYQGMGPYRYLLRHKMNLAAQDLLRTGGLVKEAAERSGYADPYHFSRVFKSIHGVSPAHFLRRSRSPS
jgi:AraC family transcriptional regulator